MARYQVHKMIQDLSHRPGLMERFQADRQGVLAEYGLTEAEKAALTEASPPALASIGVHPVLQMHYLLFSNPDMASHLSMRGYLVQMAKER
jgi:2'-aminobiphenyl-2,3-diol 1,2-dioxygenase, small subunit